MYLYRRKSKEINVQSRFQWQPLACYVICFQIENRYPFSHRVKVRQFSTCFDLLRWISGWVNEVPKDIYDNSRLPCPPQPGDINVIIAGFPWYVSTRLYLTDLA